MVPNCTKHLIYPHIWKYSALVNLTVLNLKVFKHLPVQGQQYKHYKKVGNMFNVNNKNTRTTSTSASPEINREL